MFSYFATFQILGLAFVLKDPFVVTRILTPLLVSYTVLFLFKSPEEFAREVERRRLEALKKRIDALTQKIGLYRERLEELKRSYSQLLEEKKKLEELYSTNRSEELRTLLDQKEDELKEAKKRIEELSGKLSRLKENNKELWQLLEELSKEEDNFRGREELKKLRRERKKLVKLVGELEEKVQRLEEEKAILQLQKEELEEKGRLLEDKIGSLLEDLKVKEELYRRCEKGLKKQLGDYINLLWEKIEFTPQAVADFSHLSEGVKKNLFKYLRRLDRENPSSLRFGSLATPEENIFKGRFSGGRVYFTVEDGKYLIRGILEGEDDKTKDRFIRKRFS